ncbi:MAG: hypothetical protein K940chlam3_00631 [Chlamydiae bacterium]|nr:hypothetical protein [Chlamydiota bacterium]
MYGLFEYPTLRVLNNTHQSRELRESFDDLLGLGYFGKQVSDFSSEEAVEEICISEDKLRVFHNHGITDSEAKILTKIIQESIPLWKSFGFEQKYIRKREREYRCLPRSLFYVLNHDEIKVYIQCKKFNIPIVGSGLDMVYTKSFEFFSEKTLVTSAITLRNTEFSPGKIRTVAAKRNLACKLKNVFGVLKGAKNIVELIHTHDYRNKYGIPKVGFWFEYCELGDLEKWRKEGNLLTKRDVYQIQSDVISGIEFLHNHRLCHFDIKPSNIFLCRDENGQIRAKVGDMGFAAPPEEFNGAGSPLHLAPEYWELYTEKKENKYKQLDGYKLDIWALGDLFWQFIHGEQFIPEVRHQEILALEEVKSFLALRSEFLEREYPKVPKGADSLNKLTIEMIQKDPDSRPRSINAIHSRFQKFQLNTKNNGLSVDNLCQRFESS